MNIFGTNECYYCGGIHTDIVIKHDRQGLIARGWNIKEFEEAGAVAT